jgi:hypothetical protein
MRTGADAVSTLVSRLNSDARDRAISRGTPNDTPKPSAVLSVTRDDESVAIGYAFQEPIAEGKYKARAVVAAACLERPGEQAGQRHRERTRLVERQSQRHRISDDVDEIEPDDLAVERHIAGGKLGAFYFHQIDRGPWLVVCDTTLRFPSTLYSLIYNVMQLRCKGRSPSSHASAYLH